MSFYRTTKAYKQNHKTTSLKCSFCAETFLANRKTAKFCSSSCRSGYWMEKNNKKVITLSVPNDIDDAFLDKIKDMLVNYKSGSEPTIASIPVQEKQPVKQPLTYKEHSFESEKEVRSFLYSIGIDDFKLPKHDLGIYYDEGLTIKKLENNWLVKIGK